MTSPMSWPSNFAWLWQCRGRYEEARVLLTEVIGRVPNLLDPYRKLALVVEEQGDRGKALEFCMIAARMAKTNLNLWRRAATLAALSGFNERSLLCLMEILKTDQEDWDARWDLGVLLAEIGETCQAIKGIQKKYQGPEAVDATLESLLAEVYVVNQP
ncbi:hypothetical protein WJX84_005814 [Apatococcus fuscideae]|uniref:Uncharacterized protein n=1 Tax=Apatococcus fuscideae TaxID=2026836 RepID=A0AAW1T339_9CHLO